jgi:hypothetical protein
MACIQRESRFCIQQKRFFVLKIVLNDGTGLPGTLNVQSEVMNAFLIPAATKVGFKSAFTSLFTVAGRTYLRSNSTNGNVREGNRTSVIQALRTRFSSNTPRAKN